MGHAEFRAVEHAPRTSGPPAPQGTLPTATPPAAGEAAHAARSRASGGGNTLQRTIEQELVPRLLLAHRAGPFSPAARALADADAGGVGAADRDAFLDSVLGHDERAAVEYVRELVARGVAVDAVYLDLLAPTAEALGDLWSTDECDFMEVTIALGRLQRVLRELGNAFAAGASAAAPAGRALLSAMPGEQHTLGLFMVAEFFLRDGWGVSVGTPATSDELAALVRDEWFDVVGLSAACDTRLRRVRHEVALLRRRSRNPHLVVLVGGRIFVDHPGLVGRVGADGYAQTAAGAPGCARTLLEQRSA